MNTLDSGALVTYQVINQRDPNFQLIFKNVKKLRLNLGWQGEMFTFTEVRISGEQDTQSENIQNRVENTRLEHLRVSSQNTDPGIIWHGWN